MRRSLLLLVLTMTAAACGSTAQGGSCNAAGGCGQTNLTLQLDWYPNPDHVGLYTGIDHGFFTRDGLTVTVRQPGDVSDPVKLVAAGSTDLGISYEPELFFAQQQHIPVVAVAAIVPTALNSIIARGGQGITAPADLRGKTIGVDGSASTTAYVDTVLHTAGVDPSQVHLVTVGFNLLPALLDGKVDAIAGGFQNIEGAELAARGVHTVVFPVDRYGVPGYDELVLIANATRLRSDTAYRNSVHTFVRDLAAATAYAKAHPATALAVMRADSSPDYKDALVTEVSDTLPLLQTTSLNPAAWNRFGRWMQSQGLLRSPPDGAALVASP